MRKGENEREIRNMGLKRVGPQPEFLMTMPAALLQTQNVTERLEFKERKAVGKEVRKVIESFLHRGNFEKVDALAPSRGQRDTEELSASRLSSVLIPCHERYITAGRPLTTKIKVIVCRCSKSCGTRHVPSVKPPRLVGF